MKTAQMDLEVLRASRAQAEALTGEGTTDEAQAAAPADRATRPDVAGVPGAGIAGRWWEQKAARAGRVALGWSLSTQGLVGPKLVILFLPAGEAAALGAQGGSRWRRRIGLEDAMHLFMGGVVLRFAAAGELDPQAQTQPPDAQAREVQGTFAGKGCAVIHANGAGQAKAAKEPRHGGAHEGVGELGQGTDGEHIAAGQIADGQRLAALAVLSAKPAFKIDRPDRVGAAGAGQGGAGLRWTRRSAGRAWLGQRGLLEPALEAAQRRQPGGARVLLAQQVAQLFGAPAWMRLAQRPQLVLPTSRQALRRAARAAGAIGQSIPPLLSKALAPFTPGAASEPKLAAERTERSARLLQGGEESEARSNGRRRPRHSPPANESTAPNPSPYLTPNFARSGFAPSLRLYAKPDRNAAAHPPKVDTMSWR